MTKDRLQFLYRRYQQHRISNEEFGELRRFLLDDRNRYEVEEWLDRAWEDLSDGEPLSDMPLARQRALFASITGVALRTRNIRIFWRYAAAIILLISVGVLAHRYAHQLTDKVLLTLEADELEDISPGTNKAILTLADGREVVLDDFEGGELIMNRASTVLKNAEGILAYEPAEANNGLVDRAEVEYHTVTTPNGGQYQIQLPDGSKVILNAASKLRYPVVFSKDNRMVTFEGEGYFEVAPDADRPFLVESITHNGRQTIQVLGTEFNLNTYDRKHEIRTTVISGKVEVRHTNAVVPVVLTSGHQSIITQHGSDVSLRVAETDPKFVTAWKDGLFVFDNEELPDLLKRISRWYDVTFIYEEDMHDVRFQGNYFRNKGLLNLLQNLELTGEMVFLIEQPTDSNNDERRIYVNKH